jgi:predicted CXXCH cytochrome family protein
MRKSLVLSLTFFMAVVLVSASAYALTGACSNCHTMHNSQDGKGVVTLYDIGTPGSLQINQDEPQPQLLKASCIACHTGDVAETGKVNAANNAPIVFHLSCPSGQGGNSTLAGGDFCFVAKGVGTPDDSKGHNVAGISDQDQHINQGSPGYTPPGWDPSATPGALDDGTVNGGVATWTTQLTCDGVNGCHGTHTVAGITGAHHSNDGLTATRALNPTNIGNSYRFLSGIKGLENVDWNFNEAQDIHNEYYGVDYPTDREWTASGAGTYTNKDTISYSCAECHGFFHSKIDDTTAGVKPWLRHPTDIMLPGIDEYQYYNPDHGNVYSVEAPVARPTVPLGSSQDVNPGTDAIVMCLSCHRAHGSPEPDLLRWTYNMQAGVGDIDEGCFTCHVNKNHDQGNN